MAKRFPSLHNGEPPRLIDICKSSYLVAFLAVAVAALNAWSSLSRNPIYSIECDTCSGESGINSKSVLGFVGMGLSAGFDFLFKG